MLTLNSLTKIKAPFSVNLEVTSECNLSCAFCFNSAPVYENMMHVSKQVTFLQKSGRTSNQQIQKEKILHLLDILAEAQVFEIRLFGGEFTVFKPWREILQYAFEKKFFISFVSNGYLLNDEDVELLVRCGVKDCTISIHGTEKIHDSVTRKPGSFSKTMQAIKILQMHGVAVNIAYTPNADNIKDIYSFVKLLSEQYQISNFSISRLFSDDRYKHLELPDYIYILSQIKLCHKVLNVNISLADSFPRCKVPIEYWQYLSYCSQGVGFAQVDFNGNIKHCSATSKPLGNLLEENISNLWDKKLEKMRNLDHLPKSCKICPIFCGGGCTVSRGVDNKFSPDEFIPWPKDENWWQAIGKAVYNSFRKVIYSNKDFFVKRKSDTKKEISKYPRIQQRYRVRKESSNIYIAMFEKSGIKTLSPLALQVLLFLDGKHSVDLIYKLCKKMFKSCTKQEIEEIIRYLL